MNCRFVPSEHGRGFSLDAISWHKVPILRSHQPSLSPHYQLHWNACDETKGQFWDLTIQLIPQWICAHMPALKFLKCRNMRYIRRKRWTSTMQWANIHIPALSHGGTATTYMVELLDTCKYTMWWDPWWEYLLYKTLYRSLGQQVRPKS